MDDVVWWMNELNMLLRKLPDPNNLRWTDSQRASWIEAFSRTLDLIIATVPDTGAQTNQEE